MDPHQQLEEWLADGAVNDPPREMAFHASMCEECLARISAFDSLSGVDVGAAGSPPPLPAPTPLKVGLAWARMGTAIAGVVLAAILVVAGASQLIGLLNRGGNPGPSLVAVASPNQTDVGGFHTFGPSPATEPSPSTGPTPTPIPTFIPLPSVAPAAAPLALPYPPYVQVQSVGQTAITIRWTPSSYGGPVQKWEVWRAIGSGSLIKQGELYAGARTYTQGGLAPNTVYSYRLRAVNTTGISGWSNAVAPRTTAVPTPTPAPTVGPTASPTPTTDCNDSNDNDGDGLADLADPGCVDGSDTSELNAAIDCDDGAENDTDGFVDSADPGCANASDPSELNGGIDCDDGISNDSDILVDMNDPGCSGPTDTSELTGATCDNGLDDDGDVAVDMSDADCTSIFDAEDDPLVTLLPLGPVLAAAAIRRWRRREASTENRAALI